VQFVKDLQRPVLEEEGASGRRIKNRRFTIMDLENNSNKEEQVGSLATVFKERYLSMDFKSPQSESNFCLYCLIVKVLGV